MKMISPTRAKMIRNSTPPIVAPAIKATGIAAGIGAAGVSAGVAGVAGVAAGLVAGIVVGVETVVSGSGKKGAIIL